MIVFPDTLWLYSHSCVSTTIKWTFGHIMPVFIIGELVPVFIIGELVPVFLGQSQE